MSCTLAGKGTSLRIEFLPTGLRLIPSFGQAETIAGAGDKSSSGDNSFVSGDKFTCPLDFSKPETMGYWSIDLKNGENSVMDEQLAKLYGIDPKAPGDKSL